MKLIAVIIIIIQFNLIIFFESFLESAAIPIHNLFISPNKFDESSITGPILDW